MNRTGYRPLVIFGGITGAVGVLMLAFVNQQSSLTLVVASMLVLGLGFGFIATPYLVAVQNAVPWNRRGVATSAAQFFRTIGGAVAVAVFGAILNAQMHSSFGRAVNANAALDPQLRATLSPGQLASLTSGLASGLHAVFLACGVLSICGLVITFFFPAGSTAQHAHQEIGVPKPI
jgi:MFS family permease